MLGLISRMGARLGRVLVLDDRGEAPVRVARCARSRRDRPRRWWRWWRRPSTRCFVSTFASVEAHQRAVAREDDRLAVDAAEVVEGALDRVASAVLLDLLGVGDVALALEHAPDHLLLVPDDQDHAREASVAAGVDDPRDHRARRRGERPWAGRTSCVLAARITATGPGCVRLGWWGWASLDARTRALRGARAVKLARQDSNLDCQDQNPMCYRYTTGQSVREDSSRCWPAVALRSERGPRPTHTTQLASGQALACLPSASVARRASDGWSRGPVPPNRAAAALPEAGPPALPLGCGPCPRLRRRGRLPFVGRPGSVERARGESTGYGNWEAATWITRCASRPPA